MIDLDLFFGYLKGRCLGTNFGQNLQNDLHSAPWHFKTSGSAMAEGPRDALSVEILQLENIPFEN